MHTSLKRFVRSLQFTVGIQWIAVIYIYIFINRDLMFFSLHFLIDFGIFFIIIIIIIFS